MKKLGKIVPIALLVLMLSTLAACGCGGTAPNDADMVENTTETQNSTGIDETVMPPVADEPIISGNGVSGDHLSGNDADMNGGNSTVIANNGTDDGNLLEDTGDAAGNIIDDAGNAVDDVLDGAGNAVNDAANGVSEGVKDMTGNGNNR